MKLGFIYAGQGSQHPGMGRDLYDSYPEFAAVYDAQYEGADIKKSCFESDAEALAVTSVTQPCMVAFAAGVTALLYKEGIVPEIAAGLSLGEYSALLAAGVFDTRTAVELAAFRGRAMERAALGTDSAMFAVLGADPAKLKEICASASSDTGKVSITNRNCPGQIVISGERKASEAAAALALESGAKRAVPLKVSGPFHTDYMLPAGRELAERFKTTAFGDMRFPVVFNATGLPLGEDETVAELLVKQVSSGVLLEDCIKYLENFGVDTVIEIGPGNAVSSFVKKTAKNIKTFSVTDAESFRAAVLAVKSAE